MTYDPNLFSSLARQYTGGINAPVTGQAGYVAIVNADSNNLDYIAPAVARGGVYFVTDYGADPTGATDSTAALKAAFEAAAGVGSTGGTVVVPDGDYLIAGTGPDSGGVVATLARSLRVVCGPQARFFTDSLDNDMIRFTVPVGGTGLPTDGITFEWEGGLLDQREQCVSTVVPFIGTYPPVKAGTSSTTDGLSADFSFTSGAVLYNGCKRATVRGATFVAGDHWESAGGDSGLNIGAGCEQTTVSDCTFVAARDLGCYLSRDGTGAVGGTCTVENCTFVSCMMGVTVKRGTSGFTFRDNRFYNCMVATGAQGVTAYSADGLITGNRFEACSYFANLVGSTGVTCQGNMCVSLGATLADGTTAIAPYGGGVAAGFLLRGALRCVVRDERCWTLESAHGTSGNLVYLTDDDEFGPTVISEYNLIADCYTYDFGRVVEEPAGEGNYNRCERCYNYGSAGARDPQTNGAQTTTIRLVPASMRWSFEQGCLYGDGTAAAPTVARRANAANGMYFSTNFTGLASAGVKRLGCTTTGLEIPLAASATPATNGEMMIEATSNTSLTIKYKGSDGTVRSVVLTIS